MRCPSCSQEVPDGADPCPACGATTGSPGEFPTAHEPGAPSLSPGSVFAGRFTIVERAHAGGMGIVYKALDNHLSETVALKLIRPQYAGSHRFAERFRREVRLTRHITHPNVGRVHDLGDSEGTLYFSMQWIRGESLAQLLRKAKRIELDRAIEIAQKICAALVAAHQAGVVHRDLKPGNVMVDERGEVFVVDFGLAVELEPGEASRPSLAGGTPLYMAPEQARGERVDERADLYALGVVLREMITGSPRGTALGELSTSRPEVLVEVDRLLARLLEPDPDRRPATAAQVLDHLQSIAGTRPAPTPKPAAAPPWRRLVGAALGLGLVLAAAWYLFLREPDPGDPIADLVTSADTYYERGRRYLREEAGSTQNLETALQMFHRAVAKDSAHAPAWAALGEAYWIRFDTKNEETTRQEAVRAVERAQALDPDLEQTKLAAARGFLATGEFADAERVLEAVVAESPENDFAWEYLGRAHMWQDGYEAGLAALRRAIRLRPESFQHYSVLGHFYQHFSEYPAAIVAYEKAGDLKPDSPLVWNNVGTVYLLQGKYDEAARAFETALGFEDDAIAWTNLGNAHYFSGRYEEAVEPYRRATELEPQEASLWGNLGDALVAVGRREEAREAYGRAVPLAREKVLVRHNDPQAHKQLALWCARAGEAECAREQAEIASALSPDNAEIEYATAIVHCLLGDYQQAVGRLERAVRLGVTRARLESEPEFQPLRELEGYRRVLALAG